MKCAECIQIQRQLEISLRQQQQLRQRLRRYQEQLRPGAIGKKEAGGLSDRYRIFVHDVPDRRQTVWELVEEDKTIR